MIEIEKLKSCRKELTIKHKNLIDEFFNEDGELASKILSLQMAITGKEIDVLNLKIELAVTNIQG